MKYHIPLPHEPWSDSLHSPGLCSLGGGGGGSSQPQTVTSTTTQELSPEQRQLLSSVIPVAEGFVQNPPTNFPGDKLAPINPLEQQGQNLALTAAQGSVQNIADRSAQ